MTQPITREAIATWRTEITGKSIQDVLRWSNKKFGKDMGMTTAFGYSGVVLLYYAKDIIPDLDVYFIDTGYHFKETLDFANMLAKEWKLNLKVVKTHFASEELERHLGHDGFSANPNLCCNYLKVEPLLRVLPEKKIWLNALRQDQSVTRAALNPIEVDGRGTVKIYPLATMSKSDAWGFIKNNNLHSHPLYDQGYTSIGCQPCTSKTTPESDEREGRWKSMLKLECGINV